MKINVIAVGKIKEDYIRKGIEEYAKRLSRFCVLNIYEVNECNFKNTPSQSDIQLILSNEAENIQKYLNGVIVAMDINGKQLSSEGISEYIQKTKLGGGSEITFVIGGSYGIDDSIKRKADLRLSFGAVTYPHQLFRMLVVEQIYRAFMIESNSAYHK